MFSLQLLKGDFDLPVVIDENPDFSNGGKPKQLVPEPPDAAASQDPYPELPVCVRINSWPILAILAQITGWPYQLIPTIIRRPYRGLLLIEK